MKERIIAINQRLRCTIVYAGRRLKTVTVYLTRREADEFGRALLDPKGESHGTIRVAAFTEPLADGRKYLLTISGLEKAPTLETDDLEHME